MPGVSVEVLDSEFDSELDESSPSMASSGDGCMLSAFSEGVVCPCSVRATADCSLLLDGELDVLEGLAEVCVSEVGSDGADKAKSEAANE